MKILGIHDGHNASAAIVVDGKLIVAKAEERLSRLKHHYGCPKLAIEKVLAIAGLRSSELDGVAMATPTLPPAYFYTSRNSKFSIEDYWLEQREYWYPKLYENKSPNYMKIFKKHIDSDSFFYDESFINNEADHEGMFAARRKHLAGFLGVDEQIVSVHDHHDCHAAYGYISCCRRSEKPVLVYTMDGGGDGVNGTVSIGMPGEPLQTLSRSKNCNIGRIYRYITLLLGMRPADHEYKLMGLAAYSSGEHAQKAYKIFADTLQVDGLGFKYKNEIKDHFFHFKKQLEGERFDAIAYGVQKYTEELLCEWIVNGMKETGIKDVVMSGGVAQNIKANKIIWEQEGLESLFIPPGPGDESISVGAAFNEAVNRGLLIDQMQPLKNAYFAGTTSDRDVNEALHMAKNFGFKVEVSKANEIASLLASGEAVARFGTEAAEFGARALGSRSIIADPRHYNVIHHINKLIKMRDFWMPFAPSILEERAHDYLINPKNIDANFMAVGFDTTPLAHRHLTAGLHPFDKSARPQIVRLSDNPAYHELIKAFEKLTGVGAVLNTSFNIHGEPIVETPCDAVDTFNRCGLSFLLLGRHLISKHSV
ncbi:carbamoyltransferase [Alphaproteobacteria bacterium]|nr:carbamoyltransferase [Alphaproteobacteria bacterium]